MEESNLKIRKFYGDNSKRTNKTWEQKKIKLERCADDFSRHPISTTRHQRIDDPIPIYEFFPRQQMAFDYVKTCQEDVHVFAREKGCDGKRIYIVATLPQFWYKYTRECSPEDRNYYEVIPEGAACRLYFDLEFKTEFNPGKDGTRMLETFIKYVCHHLKDMYDVNCNRRNIIDLDSSTSAKFSRHLIFHLPGVVHKDNIHTGNFVRHICKLLEIKLGIGSEMVKNEDASTMNAHPTIQTELLTENGNEDDDSLLANAQSTGGKEDKSLASVSLQELQELIIKDGKGSCGTFCDQGVYTKNRNFRIFKSTKIGKNSPLVVSMENTFKPSLRDRKGSFSKDPEYLLFLDSLVSNVSMQTGGKDVKVLTCESCAKLSKRTPSKGPLDAESPTSSQSGYEHSPYPEIDNFISQVINKGGVQGEIRRWVFFPQGKLLTYDILKNRWCENIGRAHKSNHIMMVADLRLGVYYQKCHDPDCKNIDYHSPERPIPEEINPLSTTQLSEFVSEDCDDQELCQLVTEYEDCKNSEELNTSNIEETIESRTVRDQSEIVYSVNHQTKTCQSCRLSQEKCRCDISVATSHEEVADWLEDDPVSDLELSFAAEEFETTAYQ